MTGPYDRSGGEPDGMRRRQRRRPYPGLHRYPAHVDWHQRFEPAPVYKLLDDAVARFGEPVLHRFPRAQR